MSLGARKPKVLHKTPTIVKLRRILQFVIYV